MKKFRKISETNPFHRRENIPLMKDQNERKKKGKGEKQKKVNDVGQYEKISRTDFFHEVYPFSEWIIQAQVLPDRRHRERL